MEKKEEEDDHWEHWKDEQLRPLSDMNVWWRRGRQEHTLTHTVSHHHHHHEGWNCDLNQVLHPYESGRTQLVHLSESVICPTQPGVPERSPARVPFKNQSWTSLLLGPRPRLRFPPEGDQLRCHGGGANELRCSLAGREEARHTELHTPQSRCSTRDQDWLSRNGCQVAIVIDYS